VSLGAYDGYDYMRGPIYASLCLQLQNVRPVGVAAILDYYRITELFSWLVTWIEADPYEHGFHYWRTSGVGGDGKAMLIAEYNISAGHYLIWISLDGGATWTDITTAIGYDNIFTVAVGNDSTTMAAFDLSFNTTGQMLISLNRGVDWTVVSGPVPPTTLNIESIGIGSDSLHMVICYGNWRIFKTENAWSTYTELQPKGNVDGFWNGVAIGPDNQTVVAAEDAGQVYLSVNGGSTWSVITPPESTTGNWTNPAVGPDNQTIFIGETSGRLWISHDRGETWTEQRPIGNTVAEWNTVSIGGDLTMLALISFGRVYKGTSEYVFERLV